MHNERPRESDAGADLSRQIAAGMQLASGRAPRAAAARVRYARSFCHAILAAYWQRLAWCRGLQIRPLAVELVALPEPAARVADEIANAASQLSQEDAEYQLGLTYTILLPQEYRSRYGVFYTPPALAERLLDQATAAGLDWSRCTALDPACGGGAFLAPVARRMLASLEGCAPAFAIHSVTSRLAGLEIDPFAAWMSQVALDSVVLKAYPSAKRLLPSVVRICDSLAEEPSTTYDLVVGNPPYGRVTLSARDRKRFARSLYGHANLYGLFTDLAIQYAREGGVIAFVTPTSFLAGEYFKNLRRLLAAEAPPVSLDLLSARKGVFDGVLQETLLATYRRAPGVDPATVSVIQVGSPNQIAIAKTGALRVSDYRDRPWLVPRSDRDAVLTETLSHLGSRLADWGYGVSTGPLVWNRHKSQLRSRSSAGAVPLIWAESVRTDGTFEYSAEKRNHKPYFVPKPTVDDWLLTRTPCVLVQRTTAKEQPRRLIAAALPRAFLQRYSAVAIENHLNMVRPIVRRPPVAPETVAAFLNSAAADRAFRCVSGSVAVSAYELESLPLPEPARLRRLQRLVERGASRFAIEMECSRLFAVLPV